MGAKGAARSSAGTPTEGAVVAIHGLPKGTTTGALVAFLCDTAKISSGALGKITLFGKEARVELKKDDALRKVEANVSGALLNGSPVLVSREPARGAAKADDARARPQAARAPDPLSLPEERLARLDALLAIEARAVEEAETEARRGLADKERELRGDLATRLEVVDEDAGLAGRPVLTLARSDGAPLLAGFRVGERVEFRVPKDEEGPAPRAIVSAREEKRVTIVLDRELPDWLPLGLHAIERIPDETTQHRMRAGLAAVRRAAKDKLAELRDLVAGEREPGALTRLTPPEDALEGLNEAQRAAVAGALAAPDLALIHGPPGTGKTTTVVGLIRAAAARDLRVLACAPSNAATDLLVERLVAAGVRVVRLGHPARQTEGARKASLDLLRYQHDDAVTARKLFREARDTRGKLSAERRARISREERRALWDEARALERDAKRLLITAEMRVLDGAQVICGTLTGLDPSVLGERRFDLAVVDEAAQALEPAAWLAIARADRAVLAGDHCQLPPTVISALASREGLAETLFERAHAAIAESRAHLLTTQYRMHEAIGSYSNEHFYAGKLRAHATCAAHTLADLGLAGDEPLLHEPLWVVDTSGAGLEEERDAKSPSLRNPGEARAAARMARRLLASGLEAAAIGIISPYAAQVALLKELLAEEVRGGLTVDTADGFQGREREAVIVSLTRSNGEGELGFLSDHRRMNVAMTRARRLLVLLADAATAAHDPFYDGLFRHAEALGALKSVWEMDVL